MAAVPHPSAFEDSSSRPGGASIKSTLVRWLFISLSLLFLAALLLAPLATVMAMALEKGIHAYLASFADPDTAAALRLTLITALVVVPHGAHRDPDVVRELADREHHRPPLLYTTLAPR